MSTPSLTPEERRIKIAELEKALADFEQKPESLPSESDKFRGRLLSELEKAGIKIAGEAGGAAIGQKAGMLAGAPLAPFTFGTAPLIGAAIGGFTGGMAGYEATTRGLGEEPTMRGRLQAGLMGSIPTDRGLDFQGDRVREGFICSFVPFHHARRRVADLIVETRIWYRASTLRL